MFITFVLEREYNRLIFPLHYNNRGACKRQAEIIPVKPDPDNAGVGKTDLKRTDNSFILCFTPSFNPY